MYESKMWYILFSTGVTGYAGLFLAVRNKFILYVSKIYYRGTNEIIDACDNGLKYFAIGN